jgi:hypothetical protein
MGTIFLQRGVWSFHTIAAGMATRGQPLIAEMALCAMVVFKACFWRRQLLYNPQARC